MKKILVKYTIEIPEARFEKACFKAMIGNKDLTIKIRDMAEVHGRANTYAWVNEMVGGKQ